MLCYQFQNPFSVNAVPTDNIYNMQILSVSLIRRHFIHCTLNTRHQLVKMFLLGFSVS